MFTYRPLPPSHELELQVQILILCHFHFISIRLKMCCNMEVHRWKFTGFLVLTVKQRCTENNVKHTIHSYGRASHRRPQSRRRFHFLSASPFHGTYWTQCNSLMIIMNPHRTYDAILKRRNDGPVLCGILHACRELHAPRG